jgi:hypothetical protein
MLNDPVFYTVFFVIAVLWVVGKGWRYSKDEREKDSIIRSLDKIEKHLSIHKQYDIGEINKKVATDLKNIRENSK